MASILNIKKNKSASVNCKILFSKPKISQKELHDSLSNNIGFEYNPTILTDKALIHKILDSNDYLPKNEFIIDFNYDFSKLMELKELKDESSKGTFVGMAVLGAVGFFAFSFTIIGGIAGGVLGIILGRYAGKKIVRKAKDKTSLTEFELFTTKLECMMKWMKLEKKKCQFNINHYRFVLEKVVHIFKMAFFYEEIPNKNQKKILMYLIKKLRKELMSPRNQMTLLLSYRLFKNFMKTNQNNKETLANIINNVFVPLQKICSFKTEQKTNLKLPFFVKLQKLLNNPTIIDLLKNHPDLEISNEYKTIFLTNLNVKINITKTMLEFFGTNPFLQNLFINDKENLDLFKNNNQKKKHDDPILQNLIKNYANTEYEKKEKPPKTIFSEGDSSIFSANDEDIVLELPKSNLLSIKLNGDKKQNHLDLENYDKKIHDDYFLNNNNMGQEKSNNNFIIHTTPNEERKIESLCYMKSEGSFKSLEKQSFAMNRRGDEFLKMPSLTALPKNTKKKIQCLEDKQQLPSYVKFDTIEVKPINEKNEEIDYGLRQSVNKKTLLADVWVENNFTMLTEYVNEDVSTWDKVTKNKFLEVHRRKVPGSPCVLIKAIAILENISKETIFDQIYTTEKRMKWDTVFGEFKQIEIIDEVTDVIYFLINAPFGVTNRDFVQKRVYRFNFPEQDVISIQFKSIDHPMVPIKKNCIRAETFISGYIISTDPYNKNNSILKLVTQVDVKGSIPKSIVNYTASKAPIDWINNLRKACIKSKL